MKKLICILLSLIILLMFVACNDGKSVVLENPALSHSSERISSSDQNEISSNTTLNNSSSLNSSSHSEDDTSSNQSDVKEISSVSGSTDGNNDEISKATSSQISTVTVHTHHYYRPQNHYKYIGDGTWDGSGWRDEETRGKVFPTCTEQGFTVYVCSDCNHVKYDDYVPATGHKLSKETEYVFPGYQTTGYSYLACVNDGCSYEKQIETYPAREGDLSGLDSAITFRRNRIYDSYSFNGECTMSIVDCRTWGSVPTITIDYQEKNLIVQYALKDGTIHNEIIDFPNKISDIDGLYYMGTITDDGTIAGNYMRLGNFDGNSD